MNERRSENIFLAGMVLSMTCWGFSWTAGKIISSYSDPLTISFLRFAITFLSLLIIVLVIREKLTIELRGIRDLVFSSLLISLYTYLFFRGLIDGKAGFGGVLVTVLNPIFSYVIMLVIARRVPTQNESVGLFLGLLAGIVLLKLFSNANELFRAGNIYFLFAALCWAVLSWFTSRAKRYGSSITFSFLMYAISTIIMMLMASLPNALETITHADFRFWGNMFFSGTITTALATTFYFAATSRIGASKASSFIFMVPFSAALGSFIFLGEVIEWHTIVGGVLGIAAVYILNRRR